MARLDDRKLLQALRKPCVYLLPRLPLVLRKYRRFHAHAKTHAYVCEHACTCARTRTRAERTSAEERSDDEEELILGATEIIPLFANFSRDQVRACAHECAACLCTLARAPVLVRVGGCPRACLIRGCRARACMGAVHAWRHDVHLCASVHAHSVAA